DYKVTGVQTCALPISGGPCRPPSVNRLHDLGEHAAGRARVQEGHAAAADPDAGALVDQLDARVADLAERPVDVVGLVGDVVQPEIGRASCRERVWRWG